MNRPKIEDYQEKIEIENGWETRLKTVKYRVDLEKYCDELEKALEEEKGKVRIKVTFPEEKIEEIKEECFSYIEKETEKYAKANNLKELVDKATPKYPIVKIDSKNITTFKCPTCNDKLVGTCTECFRKIKYCSECGQKFDAEWEAVNE